jgi:hypothetical protein
MDNIEKLSEVNAQGEAGHAPAQQRTAEYVARASFELSEMAARAELPLLKYLLDMVIEEAVQQGHLFRQPRADTR